MNSIYQRKLDAVNVLAWGRYLSTIETYIFMFMVLRFLLQNIENQGRVMWKRWGSKLFQWIGGCVTLDGYVLGQWWGFIEIQALRK